MAIIGRSENRIFDCIQILWKGKNEIKWENKFLDVGSLENFYLGFKILYLIFGLFCQKLGVVVCFLDVCFVC